MNYNILVSFESRDWLRQGALVAAAIEEFGPATRILGNTWFVCSDTPAEDVASSLQQVLDPLDALLILDLGARIAAMSNVDDRSVHFLEQNWRRVSASSQDS